MEPSEIRAEIERRKRHAEDLKLRERLWSLHGYLRFYDKWKLEDPEWVYPGIPQGSRFSDSQAQFRIGQTDFELKYTVSKVSSDSYRSARNLPEAETVHASLTVTANGEGVFDFDVCKTTTYHECGPTFDERLGEITRFIEGPWVEELVEFMAAIEAHRNSVSKKRREASEARELEAMKKRFGL